MTADKRTREKETSTKTHASAKVSPPTNETVRSPNDRFVEERGRPGETRDECCAEDADEESYGVQTACRGDGTGQARRDGAGDEESRHAVRGRRVSAVPRTESEKTNQYRGPKRSTSGPVAKRQTSVASSAMMFELPTCAVVSFRSFLMASGMSGGKANLRGGKERRKEGWKERECNEVSWDAGEPATLSRTMRGMRRRSRATEGKEAGKGKSAEVRNEVASNALRGGS